MKPKQPIHIYSPRLVHPEQAEDFQIEIFESPPDATSTDGLSDQDLVLSTDELFLELDCKEGG